MKLTNEQTENQDDEPSVLKSAGTSGQPGPFGLLFQQTGNRNLKRYEQLRSKVEAEKAHTLTLNNRVVLRKLGVAMKPKSKNSKAALLQAVLPPPTPRKVKERATKKAATEKQRKQTGRRFENSGSESEDSEDLPIISVKRTVQTPAEAQAGSAQASEQPATNPVPDTGSDQDTIPALGGEMERNPGDPTLSHPGDQTLSVPTEKKKRTTRKARLLSYSTREDSQDETASKRSGRKRTDVTKMGGVMIYFISKNDKEWGKVTQKLKLKNKTI